MRLQVLDGTTIRLMEPVILSRTLYCLLDKLVGVDFRKRINLCDSLLEYFFMVGTAEKNEQATS